MVLAALGFIIRFQVSPDSSDWGETGVCPGCRQLPAAQAPTCSPRGPGAQPASGRRWLCCPHCAAKRSMQHVSVGCALGLNQPGWPTWPHSTRHGGWALPRMPARASGRQCSKVKISQPPLSTCCIAVPTRSLCASLSELKWLPQGGASGVHLSSSLPHGLCSWPTLCHSTSCCRGGISGGLPNVKGSSAVPVCIAACHRLGREDWRLASCEPKC